MRIFLFYVVKHIFNCGFLLTKEKFLDWIEPVAVVKR